MSARQYLGIDADLAIVAAPRDPCIFEFQGPLRTASNQAISIATHNGSSMITPQEYMHTALALHPDLIIAMSDEVIGNAKTDRLYQSINRTVQWLKECMEVSAQASVSVPMLACIQGGQCLEYRQQCAQHIGPLCSSSDSSSNTKNPLLGVCIGGLGTGEGASQRHQIIDTCLKEVPRGALHMVSGVSGDPGAVLSAVAQGIDLFDMSYIADLTAGGYALYFDFLADSTTRDDKITSTTITKAEEEVVDGRDDTKMNLWADSYKSDARPLVPGCRCLTCANHTRAYIHHLLVAHEMTAQVLLEAHNTAHYLKFFGDIRYAIEHKKLEERTERFMEQRRRWSLRM